MKKLEIDPEVIIRSAAELSSKRQVATLWICAAYYVKSHGKVPANIKEYPKVQQFFNQYVKPALDNKPYVENGLDSDKREELLNLVDCNAIMDDEEKKVLKDMLTMWWGRGCYSRKEMIYTQKMCKDRTGMEGDRFNELKKWLKANECLSWENKPYGDYVTSYHVFDEKKLYDLLEEWKGVGIMQKEDIEFDNEYEKDMMAHAQPAIQGA